MIEHFYTEGFNSCFPPDADGMLQLNAGHWDADMHSFMMGGTFGLESGK